MPLRMVGEYSRHEIGRYGRGADGIRKERSVRSYPALRLELCEVLNMLPDSVATHERNGRPFFLFPAEGA